MCVNDKLVRAGEGPSIIPSCPKMGWLMEGKHNGIAGPRGALVENANLCSFGHP